MLKAKARNIITAAFVLLLVLTTTYFRRATGTMPSHVSQDLVPAHPHASTPGLWSTQQQDKMQRNRSRQKFREEER